MTTAKCSRRSEAADGESCSSPRQAVSVFPQERQHTLNDSEVTKWLTSRNVSKNSIHSWLAERGMYSKDRSRGRECRTFRATLKVGRVTKRIYYVRFVVNVHLASRKRSFSWPTFAKEYLGVDDQSSAEWASVLQNVWQSVKPLIRKLGIDREEDGPEFSDDAPSEGSDDDWNPAALMHGRSIGKNNLPDDKMVTQQPFSDVVQTFFHNPLLALGLNEVVMRERYSAQELHTGHKQVSLVQRLEMMLGKLRSMKRTTSAYIRITNMYLVWLNDLDKTVFADSGILRIEPGSVFKFMKAYVGGTPRMSGREPSIADVLQGKSIYVPHTKATPISSSTFDKMVSALSSFRAHQCNMLCELAPPQLRKFAPLTTLERSVRKSEGGCASKESIVDKQKTVRASTVSLKAKSIQSDTSMRDDSFAGIRNRAMILTKTFSMERQDEASKWDLSDLWPFTYGKDLATTGCMDITVLYCQQNTHKSNKDKSLHASKLFVRRKEVELCPLSSISVHLFDRFVRMREPFPEIGGERDAWYSIKLFREVRDRFEPVHKSTAYAQKRELLKKTGEEHKSVCHEDRKAGAIIARICDIHESDLESLGLWGPDLSSLHYSNIHTADLVGKLSGFGSGTDYFLPRAHIDPFSDRRLTEHQALFRAFMPELDDTVLERKLMAEFISNEHRAGFNTFRALRLLRLIFWQDCPFLMEQYPELSLWKLPLFIEHVSSMQLWSAIQQVEEHRPTARFSIRSDIPSTSEYLPPELNEDMLPEIIWKRISSFCQNTTTLHTQVEYLTDDVRELSRKMDGLSDHAKRGAHERPPDNNLQINEPAVKKPRAYLLSSLPELNELTIWDVHRIWTQRFTVAGHEYEPLRVLEEKRHDGQIYRHPALKTKILRCRQLAEFVEKKAEELQSLERSLSWIDEKQVELGVDKKVSLYHFWSKFVVSHRQQETKQFTETAATCSNQNKDRQ